MVTLKEAKSEDDCYHDASTAPLHQGQLRYMVGNSPTMGGFPTTIWKTNH